MIDNPFAQKEIRFYDWDDTLIGVLSLPDVTADMREFVNFFVEQNFIHPNLRAKNYIDPWAEERSEGRAKAREKYPNRKIYPVESWYFTANGEGMKMEHSLCFKSLTERKGVKKQ